MKTRKKTLAVIFDCDGVLFDSKHANIHFYNHLLEHFGLPPMDEDEVAYVHMHTADESIRRIFRRTPHTEAALAYRQVMDYSPFILDMVPEPGLREILACLGVETGLAVATNRSDTIGAVLEHHGLDGFFDMVVSSLDVKRPKPDPEALLKILSYFDIGASQALYVGGLVRGCGYGLGRRSPVRCLQRRWPAGEYHVDDLREVARIVLG